MMRRESFASARTGRKLVSMAALFAVPLPLLAQQTTPPEQEVGAELETVLVTGTSLARSALDTPLAATSIDEDRLAKLTANSQADILNSVPTIKAEGGGGEVAANVFIKGLPSGGQYQFTPLEYDGIPVFSSFGLNSSAFDVYYRNDLGIERLEFVRGGVSNLFGPGSVAGLINYISKTGSDTPEQKVQLEFADEDRARGDFFMSGPLGADSNLYYALSGFYRYDEGPIKTGNDTEGFQLRGNLKREFEDGSGAITIYGQYIDDQVQFYLPFPLDGASRSRIRGNDGDTVYSVQTSQVDGMGFVTPDGQFSSSIGDGVVTKDGSLAIVFDKEFGEGWGVNAKAKYASYDHSFDFFLDGDGVVNVPETQAAFIANRNPNRGLPATASLANSTFTYADTGEVLPAGAILFPNRFIDRDRPAEDTTAELNLKKSLQLGAFEHSFTVGAFLRQCRGGRLQRHHDLSRGFSERGSPGQSRGPRRARQSDDVFAERPAERRQRLRQQSAMRRRATRSTSPIRWRASAGSSTSAPASRRWKATSVASVAPRSSPIRTRPLRPRCVTSSGATISS